mmetsp:Transcript_6640/g.16013  ORF Transcript_6640/g.16013 Transcript_6640/m.16013 type:complete len:218 (-) Transcript_6640:389-1042(-)
MPLNDIANPELAGCLGARVVAKVLAVSVAPLQQHVGGARPRVGPPLDGVPQTHHVEPGDSLRVGENLGHVNRYGDLADVEVRVRRNDGPSRVVNPLARQIPPEPPLLALEPLREAPHHLALAALHRKLLLHPRQLRVEVVRDLELEVAPALHDIGDGASLVHRLLQRRVGLDDLGDDDSQVVLVAPRPHPHRHAGPDAAGGHGEVREDELLGARVLG